jgi:hypothetical protein
MQVGGRLGDICHQHMGPGCVYISFALIASKEILLLGSLLIMSSDMILDHDLMNLLFLNFVWYYCSHLDGVPDQ